MKKKGVFMVGETYEVLGEEVFISDDLEPVIHALATEFYKAHGYTIENCGDDFSFSESQHPQEQFMYKLALTAYVFNKNIGLE